MIGRWENITSDRRTVSNSVGNRHLFGRAGRRFALACPYGALARRPLNPLRPLSNQTLMLKTQIPDVTF
jgi:hypothetical protein